MTNVLSYSTDNLFALFYNNFPVYSRFKQIKKILEENLGADCSELFAEPIKTYTNKKDNTSIVKIDYLCFGISFKLLNEIEKENILKNLAVIFFKIKNLAISFSSSNNENKEFSKLILDALKVPNENCIIVENNKIKLVLWSFQSEIKNKSFISLENILLKYKPEDEKIEEIVLEENIIYNQNEIDKIEKLTFKEQIENNFEIIKEENEIEKKINNEDININQIEENKIINEIIETSNVIAEKEDNIENEENKNINEIIETSNVIAEKEDNIENEENKNINKKEESLNISEQNILNVNKKEKTRISKSKRNYIITGLFLFFLIAFLIVFIPKYRQNINFKKNIELANNFYDKGKQIKDSLDSEFKLIRESRNVVSNYKEAIVYFENAIKTGHKDSLIAIQKIEQIHLELDSLISFSIIQFDSLIISKYGYCDGKNIIESAIYIEPNNSELLNREQKINELIKNNNEINCE